jgi:hypothetical protein
MLKTSDDKIQQLAREKLALPNKVEPLKALKK